MPPRHQRTVALVLLVVVWTGSFAGLAIWDRRELAEIMQRAGLGGESMDEHLASELLAEVLLWATGVAGLAATFYWLRRLDTARERAFDALRRSESDLSSVVEAIDDVVFCVDAGGRFRAVAGARNLGRLVADPRLAEGRALAEVLPAGAAEALQTAVAAIAAGGEAQSIDFVTERGAGAVHWNGRVSRRGGREAGPAGVLVVARDVTHRSRAEAALRDREELWRLVYERSGEGIILTEPDGGCVAANQAACDILGLPESEFLALGPDPQSSPERTQLVALLGEGARARLARGGFTFRRSDGRRADLEGSVSLFRLSDGAVRSVIIIRDITARKAAEVAAAENALRWQGALEAAGDGLWDWDLETDHTFYSPTAVGLFGFTTAEIAPHIDEWRSRVHPDDLPAVQAVLEEHLSGHSPFYESEHRLRCRDGAYKWVRSRGRVLLRDAEGKPRRLIGTVQDVTAARVAQRQLRESEERYRMLFANAADPVVVFPIEPEGHPGLFAEVNDAACRLVGHPREELLAKSVLDLETPESLAEITSRIAAMHETGYALFEAEIFTKSGARLAVETHATLFQRAGRFWVFSSMRDLSARRRVEAEVARLARERAVLLETLPVGACLVRDRRIQWANATIERGLGYAPGTMVGLDATALHASRDCFERIGREGYPLIAQGGTFEIEAEFTRRDGSTVWGRMTGRALNPAVPADGVLWAIADISEQRAADLAVRRSEARLSSTLAAISDLILVLDREGRFAECHCPAGFPLLVPPEAFLGRHFAEVLPPPVAAQLKESLDALAASGQAHSFDYELAVDGKPFWWTAAVSRRFGADREVNGAVLVVRDISARKRAEAARRESEENLHRTFQFSPAVIVVTELESGRIIEANEQAVAVTGYSREEALGRTVVELGWMTAEMRAGIVARITADGELRDFELTGRSRRGEAVHCVLNCQVVTLGGQRRVISSLLDITARKRAELALARTQRELKLFFDQSLTGIFFATFAEPVPWDDGTDKEAALDAALARPMRVQANAALARQYGGTVDDFTTAMPGRTMEGERDGLRALWRRLFDAGRLHEETAEHRLDGTPILVEGDYTCITDAAGRISGYFCAQRDITVLRRRQRDLEEAEARLRSVSDNLPDCMVYQLDTGWHGERRRFVHFSAGIERLHGVTAEAAMRDPEILYAQILPEDRRKLAEIEERVVATQSLFRAEVRYRHPSGEIRWLYIASAPRRMADGRTIWDGVEFDITNARRTQEALAASEANYRLIADHVSDVIWVIDPIAERFTFVSPSCERLHGFTPAELCAMPAPDSLTPASSRAMAERIRERLGRILADPAAPRTFVDDMELRRKDGTTRWVESTTTYHVDATGRPSILGVSRDITERRNAAEALTESRRTYLGVFNSVTEAIYVQDESGVFLDVNEGAARMYGWTRAELTGRTPADVAAPDRNDLPAVVAMSARVFATGQPESFEFWGRRRNGDVFPKACVMSRGKFFGRDVLITTARDITGQKHAEARERQDRERLRDSEQRFRTVFDSAPIGIIEEDFSAVKLRLDELRRAGVTDLRAHLRGHPAEVRGLVDRVRVLLRNQRSLAIMADESAAAAAPGISVHLADDAWPVMCEEFCALAEGRTTFSARVPARDGQGRRRLVDLTLAVQPGHEAELDRVIVAFADITEQQRTEDERRRLIRAVEQSPVGIMITDTAGVVEYVNPQFTRATGYALAEIVGQRPRVLKSGVHPDAFYREMWQTILAGREWQGEICNRCKDGALVWENMSVSPVCDEAGRPTHYLAIKEDITERRAVREQIRQQAALLDVTQDAIFMLRLDLTVTFLNRSAQQLYGVAAGQAIGRKYDEVVYRKPPPDGAEKWKKLHEAGQMFVERRHHGLDGAEIVVQVRATLVRDAAGAPTGVLVVVTDISEAKRLEAQFLRAQRMESLGALAGGVAHDLNNVLTPILIGTGLLKPLAREPHEREMIELIVESARRGADIVQQLLLFGRGSGTPRAIVDPGAVARGIVRMVQETFPKNLTLHTSIPRHLWPVEADRTQLHQVLLNLCVNSRDAMPDGGELTVAALNTQVDEAFAAAHLDAKPGPHVALAVADTGSGIAADIVEKIFDPFFTTKPLGKGTGLGLSTVLGITRSHGGFIHLETEAGRGSRFTVFLPAKQSAVVDEAGATQAEQISGRGELILLVDDETAIRVVAEKAFLKANYRVVVAGNGAEALAAFSRAAGEVRVVVSDMMMPVMDGPQLVHALRQLDPDIPVLAISGLRDARAELQKRHGRRLRFLQKPFLLDDALRVVRELIDESARAR
ncbi:MAG: PAS domain S-box protein [Verrucomicrobia bacterium]|nr:PAS domain S-box protein [Verrucomicrobiota bacterium]